MAGPFYYAIGPYTRYREGGITFTVPPAGATGIDLRSIPGHADLTYGLFWSDKPFGQDYRAVGRGDLRDITNAPRDVIASMFGLRTLAGDTLADLIWGLLTVDADPNGENRAPPIMPTRRRQMELVLSGHGPVAQKRFEPGLSEAPPVRDLLQRQYRRIRQAALDGLLKDDVHHRRVLDYWCEKYGLTEDYFRPPDLPPETRVGHETTITESFNKTDGSLGPDLTWVDFHNSGVYEVVSQAAERVASSLGATRANSALSSDDHYAQAEFSSLAFSDRTAGVMARQAGDATQTYYMALADGPTNGETWKIISGSNTSVGAQGGTFAAGDVIQLECDGSTITRKKNGSTQNSTTDTAISGNLYTGLASVHAIAGSPAVDNFEAADLSSGTTVNASTKTLTLSEQTASIAHNRNVSAGPATKSLTTYQSTVATGTSVQAQTASKTLSTHTATLAIDAEIQAGVNALTITPNAATIAYGTNVQAGTATKTLAEQAATVTLDRAITGNLLTKTLLTYDASISTGGQKGGWGVDHDKVYLQRLRYQQGVAKDDDEVLAVLVASGLFTRR